MSDSWWAALALVLVIEGSLPFVNPASWLRVFEQAPGLSDGQLRFVGLVSIVSGLWSKNSIGSGADSGWGEIWPPIWRQTPVKSCF